METVEKIKQQAAPTLHQFDGFLFAKLHLIGSFSQGPRYYLQPFEGKDIPIIKKVQLWMDDPVLHACLGQKIVLEGKIAKGENGATQEEGIYYFHVLNQAEPLLMKLDLELKEDTLWIDKTPGPTPKYPPQMKSFTLKLSVTWPFKSVWKGECPTSQLYDFGIEDPDGKTIWQWSNCMMFRPETTKVQIPGGSPRAVKAPWYYFEDSIVKEGLYVAKAEFIASGQVIRKPFWVKFAQ